MTTPDPQEPTSRPEPGGDASPDQIEADIARTREELGETVEQLTSALDVKSQAKQQVDEVKVRAQQQVDQIKERATEQLGRTRERAAEGYTAARDAVTDDRGQLNRNGWIAASALGLYLIIRAATR
jgi:ElaB/YqjD/DUF883 family membrane-anchored ribosome-binding protein